jgi:hypothetical protein
MTRASRSVTIPDSLEYDTAQFLVPQCYEDDLRGVLISEGMIKDRIKQLAREIHANIGDQVDIIVFNLFYHFYVII